ncbi:hypothetical protein [Lactiplantibacillus plajomi]|uniref:hypothetical protein n=1 Tax=Lactiplantibacillus plajomi TaxID=1457217 RepID=UPI0010F5925F|nr:hypothetical protein [Lactiplantibacillus plajomi]
MYLKHPVSFFKSFWFWLGLLFLYIAIVGFPRQLVTAGDDICYSILIGASLFGIFSSIFSIREKSNDEKAWF